MSGKRKRKNIVVQKATWDELLVEGIGMVLIFVSMGTMLEFDELDNNLAGGLLFLIFSISGLGLGLLLYYSFFKRFNYFKQRTGQSNLYSGGLIIFFTLVPVFVANVYNRSFPRTPSVCQSYKVLNISEGGRRKNKHLEVLMNDYEEDLRPDYDAWKKYKKGDTIVLCIAKGALGFDFVKEFK